jgi:site-specific recombinase XerD
MYVNNIVSSHYILTVQGLYKKCILFFAMTVLVPAKSNDVKVYARHIRRCKNKAAKNLKKCTCPKWLYVKATQKRITARTVHWGVAEQEAQKIRDSYNPDKARIAELEAKQQRNTVTLEDAIEVWLNHKRADQVKESSVQTYRWTLRQFMDFAHANSTTHVHEVSAPLVTNWKNRTATKEHLSSQRKKRGHLRDFFRFCVETQKWIEPGENPATALTKIRGRDDVSAVPFSPEQYDAVLAATHKYGAALNSVNRKECENSEVRLRTFIETMRWSGLAIIDTALLAKSQLKNDDSLVLKRHKTDEPVVVLLPHNVADALRHLPPGPAPHRDFFFWSGNGKQRNAPSIWHRAFERLWKLVDWPSPLVALADGEQPGEGTGDAIKPHPHMLRHTFAAHLLLKHGMKVEDVARLLGHRSPATTLKYYHNFVPAEAEQLKEKLRAIYEAGSTVAGHGKSPNKPEHRLRIPIKPRTRRTI